MPHPETPVAASHHRALRVAVAQMAPVVGAFEANVKIIREAYKRAVSRNARVCLTPELSVCGYPPHDLVERPEMAERCEAAVDELAKLTQGHSCALLVGHVARNPGETGRESQNVATVLEGGRRVLRQAKMLLPTYDVFDEARYFEPASEIKLWDCDGIRVAVAICEDLWAHDPTAPRKLYPRNPVDLYRAAGAEAVFSLSASPYEWKKRETREDVHRAISRDLGVPLIYVNQVGATDEILFDGSSFAVSGDGRLAGRLPIFKPSFGVAVIAKGEEGPTSVHWESPESSHREDDPPEEVEVLTRGLTTGIREYFSRTGFKTAVLGLSGGIDSAVVAALAARALGPENVMGFAMPSQYSSPHSLEDAEQVARNLGIRFEVKPIKFLFSTTHRELAEARGGQLAPIAQENLQSRLRGMILMTLANHYGALVLTTGNKSELGTGFCTLYGDMCGALAPIGDLFKQRVYELARHLNRTGSGIPDRSITKPPSPELKPDQKDSDVLPPYEALDVLLEEYVEKRASLEEIRGRLASAAPGARPGWIDESLARIETSEFKRRQAAPVLKISRKAFGIGRRIPIAKNWAI